MISELVRQWEELSPRHPHRAFGISILERVRHLEFGALPQYEVVSVTNPTPAHIFRDLYAQTKPRYRNQLLDVDQDDAMLCDIVAGWVALAHDIRADVTEPAQIPFAASDILASERGLDTCGIKIPECLLTEDVAIRPVTFEDPGSNPRLTTTITPAGSITDPHVDGTGSGLFLFQLFGTKILFTWPASSHNLEWLEAIHGIKRGPLRLSNAVKEMTQMCITVLTRKQSVVLAPGMIHAVMSPNNSAISGWDFVKAEWLATGDVQRQMVWEAKMVNKQEAGALGHVAYNIRRYITDDLKLWELLGTKLDGEKAEPIHAMVDLVRNSL
jgi:hypothetical protein